MAAIADSKNTSKILTFYSGTTVFITGASGFIGLTLVESLLRKTDVHKIYILIRNKKNKTTRERLDAILNDDIFLKIKKSFPDRLSALQVLSGDVADPGFGISEEEIVKLMDEVNIIFHVAATVQFNENLKLATQVNVVGTRTLMDFARKVKNLKVVMHVSTAYTNGHLQDIDERIYPISEEIDLIKAMDSMDYLTADKITKQIIGESCNTYIYTKRVAEYMLEREYKDLPVGILRPGVVLGAINDPLPGWVNNLYGPTGVSIGLMSGVVHVLHLTSDSLADIVPVDTVTSCLLCAAWDTHDRYVSGVGGNEIPVYNVVSSTESPLTWNDFRKTILSISQKNPPENSLWYPFAIPTSNWTIYIILTFILHYIPGYIIDHISILSGKKPRFIKIYKKIDELAEILAPFGTSRWNFCTYNMKALWKKLDKEEQALFPFNLDNFSWSQYLELYVTGVSEFLLKSDGKGGSKGLARRLYFYHCSVIAVSMSIFLGLVSYLCTF